MKQRIAFLLRTYLWTVFVFCAAKIVFMACCHIGRDFTPANVADVLWHGLSLDLSTALYILILPLLLAMICVWWHHRKVTSNILRVYFFIISVALSLAFVADSSLYPFWGFKLDASCLQYLASPSEAAASVSVGYIMIRVVIFIAVTAIIFYGYTFMKPSASREAANVTTKISETLCYIISIPLIVIGIRGGLGESTTNIGQVYYSQNQFLNHSAVNPVFNFLASFEKTAHDIVDYHFFDDEECNELVEELYPISSTDTDSLLTTSRPNIVIVLMESAGEIMGEYMPHLQQLKHDGVYFSNCFGNTYRTDRGTVCTYSGYPSFPTSSVMKMPQKTSHLPSIASSVQQAGYRTYYLYGGDINFTNMRSYLITTGWEKLTWKADYTRQEQNTAKWGVRDDITFNTLYRQIIEMPQDEHFLFGFSTLSSHEPWDVPLKQYQEEIPNAFYYLDTCIGDFIGKLKNTPQWDNLLIIFLPDHSLNYGEYSQSHPLRNKIPLVWTGGAVKSPRVITAPCNQSDLAATLLAQLHLPHNTFRWSRDVLSDSYTYPFAIHTFNNGFSLTDSTGFMAYDLDAQRFLTVESTQPQRLERLGKAILQATSNDLKALGTTK